MKHWAGLLLICIGVVVAEAQTTPTIRRLEKQRNELHQQISKSESLLMSTKKDVKSQLSNLALLTGQIDERQKYIWQIENDVRTIQLEINRLAIELKQLEHDLKDKKKKYEHSLRYMYSNKSVQEKLMFIFSAENLNQIYRRMRYVREYADYQRRQALQLQRKQKQIEQKTHTLQASREAKEVLLRQGEAEKANCMLGRYFSYDFTVETGDKRGRLLGFPTINQFFPESFVLPKFGVYASAAYAEGRWYPAVTDIGIRPTIGNSVPRSETCILGYSGNLYGTNTEVALLSYLRGEIKFNSLGDLSKQMEKDAEKAKEIFKNCDLAEK